MLWNRTHRLTATLATIGVATALFFGLSVPQGLGVTDETAAQLDAVQQKVEESSAAYDAIMAEVEELQGQMEENQARIEEVEAELPAQREKSATAIKNLYKLRQDEPSLINMVLSAESLNDFISTLAYLNAIEETNVNEACRLGDLQDELTFNQASLEAAKAEVDTRLENAEAVMKEAEAARAELQKKAEEETLAEQAAAEAALKAQQEAQARMQALHAEQEASSGGDAGQSQSGTALTPSTNEIPSTNSGAVSSGSSSTNSSKQAFLDEWTPRIDRYLAGSPLAGYGSVFASAAWDYGVDPRWSPAISNTESSKGRVCFKPHNAWGWGSSSWSNWTEAINAHVAGLARGYGYTITVDAAKKYCPPTWESWYANTLAEMNSI